MYKILFMKNVACNFREFEDPLEPININLDIHRPQIKNPFSHISFGVSQINTYTISRQVSFQQISLSSSQKWKEQLPVVEMPSLISTLGALSTRSEDDRNGHSRRCGACASALQVPLAHAAEGNSWQKVKESTYFARGSSTLGKKPMYKTVVYDIITPDVPWGLWLSCHDTHLSHILDQPLQFPSMLSCLYCTFQWPLSGSPKDMKYVTRKRTN
nr:uncharacterized protein LOC109731011 [Microcebus murinus]